MKTSDEHTPEKTNSGPDSEPLEELLRHARQDGFTPKETEEVWSRLGAFLGAPGTRGGSSSPAGGSGSGVASAWGAKTIAMLVLGGGVVVGGGLMVTVMAGLAWHRVTPAASSDWRVVAEDDRGPASTFKSGSAGGADVEPNAGTALASTPALPPAQPPLASPPRTDVPSRSPGPHRVAPKAGPSRSGPSAADTSGESTEAIEAPSPPVAAPPPPSDPALNEGALLLRARRELESNPAETLKLAEQHGRLFAAGTLAPEREVLAIEALARLGRLSEARARFADFRARFPQSPHLARLQATLGR